MMLFNVIGFQVFIAAVFQIMVEFWN